MPYIGDVLMRCDACGPCADGSTRFGCPQADCGGFVREIEENT